MIAFTAAKASELEKQIREKVAAWFMAAEADGVSLADDTDMNVVTAQA